MGMSVKLIFQDFRNSLKIARIFQNCLLSPCHFPPAVYQKSTLQRETKSISLVPIKQMVSFCCICYQF